MKAIIPTTPGGVDVLEIQDVAAPTPADDEIRIRVKAFGLNRAESYFRQGKHGSFGSRFALGIEAAGEVETDPSGTFAIGQRVVTAMGGMMFERHGSYAELICVKRTNVIPISSDIDYATLASLPEAYLTIWGALEKTLRIQPRSSILVRGGTSSLGLAAITYAKAKALHVIATTRREDRVQRLKDVGADQVVVDDGNVRERVLDILPRGVDHAIEIVGAETLLDTMQCVRKWGSVVFVGFLAGKPVLENLHLMNDLPNTVSLSFFGSGLLGKEALPLDDAPINWVAEKVQDGSIKSIKSQTFKFEDIRRAHDLLDSNESFGKIVVTV